MRHGEPGYFAVKDGPQRGSIEADSVRPGWPEFDDYLRFYPGQFVTCTGKPGHGKSTFMLNIVCNIAKDPGMRTFLYVPENEGHIRAKLNRIWDGNQKSFEHFSEYQVFYHTAVPLAYDDPPKTIQWVLDKAAVAVEQDQVGFILIDPWNELETAKPKDQTMTDYIGQCLVYLKQFARVYNVTVAVVAHPTKPKEASAVSTLYDIEGSAHWFNKSDNGLVVHREGDNTVVYSAKVREYGAGKRGACHFFFDPLTERYTPQIGADIAQLEEARRNRPDPAKHRGRSNQQPPFD